MCRIKLKAREYLLLALTIVLCMSAGAVAADEDLTWPIRPDLMTHDSNVAENWIDVGDVAIWNDRDNVYIDIVPAGGLKLKEVAIHYVDDPADFAAVLDKKTNAPKIPSLDYRTDYLQDYGSLADRHSQVIAIADLETFDGEWCPNPDTCPPYRYFIVQAVLQQLVNDQWVDLPEDTYARNQGVFDRFPPEAAVAVGDAKYWGYVTYPRAKPEPGHFVDANVNGLGYVTVTQSGTTGDNGQFWYLPGERVAFSVGSLYLGDALGDRSVAPTDLFGGAEMDDDRVLNVARLLQSLDEDGNVGHGAINITEPVIACLESAMAGLLPMPAPEVFFADDSAVGNLIDATVAACAGEGLVAVTKEEALENLNTGMMAGNLMKRNVSKNADMKSDKAQIEILPVYVPAKRSDGSLTEVIYYNEDGTVRETRDVAKPLVVTYVEEVEGSNGAMDVFIALSRDDGDTWKRRNISRTADKSSLLGYPGTSWKPQMKVMDNLIFVAWSDKYCRGGRPGYAINQCDDPETELVETPETGCAVYCTSNPDEDAQVCTADYPGDDAYWRDDLYGVGGPQRSVSYEDYPELGEVPYSCVWAARGVMDTDPDSATAGEVQWFKPERLTSGRRDAFQITVGSGDDVAFAVVWQEDPKGLRSGEGDGPGDGWSGSNTNNKTDIWYSYITAGDFALVDEDYPTAIHGDGDVVDTDAELAGRVKALVPMSLPVRISDNEICSLQNILAEGGGEESEHDGEGQGTHRFCGTLAGIGTKEAPGSNPLCAYTVPLANPKGEIHDVCVTRDNRLLDGNTGASRPNINVQPYNAGASAWVIVGYEESKGVGIPPDGENEDEGCGGEETGEDVDEHDVRYKPDMGKNVIYHSFDLFNPETVASGGIVNLPETDEHGNPVYLVDEFGELLLDWKAEPQLAYENARRVRFMPQSGSKVGKLGKTSVVILYRQGEEGSGKPADIFMRRAVKPSTGNPYAFANIQPGAQNLSSVTPTEFFQDPFDAEKPLKMLRWTWSPANLADSSAANPHTDAHAHRGAINGDDLIIAYTLTPNWGRRGNDKYDLYIRRSFDGGQSWTTDPKGGSIEHNVVFRVPIVDYDAQTVTWDEEVVTTVYGKGAAEPPRNVSNLRNNRISVMEPRLVKTPGTITSIYNFPEDLNDLNVYQIAYGTEFNQNQLPDDVVYPQIPLDIYYGRTLDKGQHFEGVLITPQDGSGKPEEGWNSLANDHPSQGAPQIRQTPDGSRLYGIWLEESDEGSDIMFRRVDYRGASQ
jgi:hypothetical protein